MAPIVVLAGSEKWKKHEKEPLKSVRAYERGDIRSEQVSRQMAALT